MEGSLQPQMAQKGQKGRRIHVLHGLGGIEKTQLAIAYARKFQKAYSAIVWVNGSSRDTVLQSLAGFAQRAGITTGTNTINSTRPQALDLEMEARAVLTWLEQERNDRWLVIFDNVDRDVQSNEEDPYAFNNESFFPSTDHGAVLITSRLPSLRGMGQSTEVRRLKLDQAVELLSHRSGLRATSDSETCLQGCYGGGKLMIYL